MLVVFELAASFLKDLTWSGPGTLAALFVALWLSWVGFTLYANRFDTDDVVYRIAKLAATMAIAGCAASASAATSTFSTPFAACFLAGRIILLLLHVRAWRHVTDSRPTIGIYLGTTAVRSAIWAVSLAVDGPARLWLWAAAVVVDGAGPVIATWRDNHVPLHMEHLPERFGLLVLGEAVGAPPPGSTMPRERAAPRRRAGRRLPRTGRPRHGQPAGRWRSVTTDVAPTWLALGLPGSRG